MRRQTDFAESMMNSAASSAADPVTTNTFQQPADAVTFSSTPHRDEHHADRITRGFRRRDALQTA
jgi:hypothetical protein